MVLAFGCSNSNSNDPVGSRLSQVTIGSDATANPSWLIGFTNKPSQAATDLVKSLGGKISFTYTLIPAIAATMPSSAADALKRNPLVAYVEPDGVAHATADTIPWGITKVKADQVWPLPNTGVGVKLAILDTGIDYTHSDLSANYRGGYDYVNNDTDPKDDNGHGTHCAGIAGAKANGADVVGVAPDVSLFAVKVLNSAGSGSYSQIIAGLQWAVTNGMQICSMSFGGNSGSTSLQAACDNAKAAGVFLVAAAGNDGNSSGTGDSVDYPGRYSSCVAIAATDSADVRAYFSSTGPAVCLSAPGVSVLSDKLGGSTITYSGTSMATPHVAGIAALLIASGVTGPDNLKSRLIATAQDLGATGFDNLYGNGLVNAFAAVTGIIPPPPPPPPTYGNLKGKVYNSKTGKFIKNVVVKVDTGQTGKTNSNGNYTINNILTGSHNVTAALTGYNSSTLAVSITQGNTVTLNFYLTPL
jgi:subtilisin